MYVDGSLHWFTECQETKVISLDLHTEVFQVISKAPFVTTNHFNCVMCNLDNRLCVSEKKFPNQVIWCFNSGNKTWDKVYSIDMEKAIPSWNDRHLWRNLALPLANLDGEKKNKKKLLLNCRELGRQKLVIHDPETKSYDAAFSAIDIGYNTIL